MKRIIVTADGSVADSPVSGSFGARTQMTTHRYLLILALLLLNAITVARVPFASVAQAAGETPKNDIAAQIRMQGFVCDKPLRAVRDARRSRPDYQVWVLTCSNATYRVGRYPDMAAKVEVLR
jgi:hypothetical protein